MRDDIKSDLMSQIESARAYCESEIARMTERARQSDRIESYRTAAHDMRELFISFIAEGFTEEQAWELIKIITAQIKEVK